MTMLYDVSNDYPIIELFAGIAGFGLGFRRHGFRCVAHVEKDAACRRVLARHFSGVPQFDDVCTVGRQNLPCNPFAILAGFPCQDLSQAGQRAGLAGTRSGLFYEMIRIVDELRPTLLIWENVPGLLTSDEGRDFARVLVALDDIGYSGAWTSLDAQFFGLAQRRQRIFGVFAPRHIGATRCAEILSLADRLPWNTPTRPQARQDVAASLTAGSATGSGVNKPGRRREDDVNLVTGTLGAAHGKNRGLGQENEIGMLVTDAIAFAWQQGVSENDRSYITRAGDYAGAVSTSRVDAVAFKTANALSASATYDRGDGADNQVVGTLQAHSARHGHAMTTQQAAEAGHLIAATFDPRNVTSGANRSRVEYGLPANTLHSDGLSVITARDVASTLTHHSGRYDTDETYLPANGEHVGVRRLTPVECERLQGFPDGWTAGQSDSARYRQLGNAVAVAVAEWLAMRVRKVFV